MSSLLVDEAIETRRLPILLRARGVVCGFKQKPGDCCVFSSYGTVPRPSIQTGGLLFIDQLAIPGRH
jgi:hypothetical protein